MKIFLRVLMLLVTFLFGLFASVAYIHMNIVIIMNRTTMEGYFNVIGMINVIFSFTIIFTGIQSIIMQIKLMGIRPASNDLIDDFSQNTEKYFFRKNPSKLVVNSHFIYSLSLALFIVFQLVVRIIKAHLFHETTITYLIWIVVFLVCLILVYDAWQVKKYISKREVV